MAYKRLYFEYKLFLGFTHIIVIIIYKPSNSSAGSFFSATVTDLLLVELVLFGCSRNGSTVNGALYYVIVGVCAPAFHLDAVVASQMLTLDRSKRFHPSLHVPPYAGGCFCLLNITC